jgi:hypothetical protein
MFASFKEMSILLYISASSCSGFHIKEMQHI